MLCEQQCSGAAAIMQERHQQFIASTVTCMIPGKHACRIPAKTPLCILSTQALETALVAELESATAVRRARQDLQQQLRPILGGGGDASHAAADSGSAQDANRWVQVVPLNEHCPRHRCTTASGLLLLERMTAAVRQNDFQARGGPTPNIQAGLDMITCPDIGSR